VSPIAGLESPSSDSVAAAKHDMMQAGDLGDKIDEYTKLGKKFSEVQIVDWTLQLLLALQYIHGRYAWQTHV